TVLLTMKIHFQQGLSAVEVGGAVERMEQTIRSQHPDIKHIFIEAESIKASGREAAPTRQRA
ncbi:MAG: hypothetical protein ACREQ3_15115, partial [Candidatus Binatia bacterium]